MRLSRYEGWSSPLRNTRIRLSRYEGWSSPLRNTRMRLSRYEGPPGGSGWIISVGGYADNSFAAFGSSDPREGTLEL